LFLTPLVYKTNKEIIDSQISQLSSILNQQTEQVKSLASHHASVAAETTKQYVGDYSAKAQEMIGRARSQSPVATKPTTTVPSAPVKTEKIEETKPSFTSANSAAPAVPEYKSTDFPAAPQEPFVKSTPIANEFITAPVVENPVSTHHDEEEPLIAT